MAGTDTVASPHLLGGTRAAGARVAVTSRSRERAEATARKLSGAAVGLGSDVRRVLAGHDVDLAAPPPRPAPREPKP
jgi:hypothetical protein